MAATVLPSSWPGLSGPSVAAQVLEGMARISRAMTEWQRLSLIYNRPYTRRTI